MKTKFEIGETVYMPIMSWGKDGEEYIADVWKGIVEDVAISRKAVRLYYVHFYKDGMSTKHKQWLPESTFVKKKRKDEYSKSDFEEGISTQDYLDFFRMIKDDSKN